MQTPARVAKHPIHPMLVPIPIGLWIFSLICDLIFVYGGGGEAWRTVAFYTMAGGIAGALIAAVPGFIDMLSLRDKVKQVALVHMTLNLILVALYAGNLGWRVGGAEGLGPVWLSALAVALLGVSGWLGGKMVYVHGVGVEPAPDLEAHRQRRRDVAAG